MDRDHRGWQLSERAGRGSRESTNARAAHVGDRVEYIGADLGLQELPRGYGWLRRGALGTVIDIGGAGEVWVGWDTGGEFQMAPEEFCLTGEREGP